MMLAPLLIYISYCFQTSLSYQEIFTEDLDKMVEEVVNMNNESRRQAAEIIYTMQSKPMTPTTQRILLTPPGQADQQGNLTLETIKKRRLLLEAEMILRNNRSGLPDFESPDDEFEILTRRFSNFKDSEVNMTSPSRREYYHDYWEEIYRRPIEKVKTVHLMAQFVYMARYKLPLAQRMKKKYKDDTNYQIGYCFNLLRRLKIEQMVVYNSIRILIWDWAYLNVHVKLFEKIVRLDVDIKDLMKFLYHLEIRRRNELKAEFGDDYDNYV